MPPRSAVERSEHRDKIDNLLLEGKSPRFVSTYLENEYNEHISHTAINNYRKNKMNIPKEVAIEYNKKKEAIQKQEIKSKSKKNKAVKKSLSDLEKLDEIIDESFNTQVDLERLVNDPTCDQVKVEGLKLKMRQQGISAVNAKNNILKQEETNVEVNVDSNVTVNLLSRVKQKRNELNELRGN